MAITPTYKGNTAPAWIISLVPDSGVVNVGGLVTSNFSLRIRNMDTGIETTGTGIFSNITAATTTIVAGQTIVTTPATVQYQLSTGDVATISNNRLWVDVTFPNGVQPFALGSWQVVNE